MFPPVQCASVLTVINCMSVIVLAPIICVMECINSVPSKGIVTFISNKPTPVSIVKVAFYAVIWSSAKHLCHSMDNGKRELILFFLNLVWDFFFGSVRLKYFMIVLIILAASFWHFFHCTLVWLYVPRKSGTVDHHIHV